MQVCHTYEMLRRLRFFCMDLPHLKTMIQAGGKVNTGTDKEYAENAQKVGKRSYVMYGQTESGPRIHLNISAFVIFYIGKILRSLSGKILYNVLIR